MAFGNQSQPSVIYQYGCKPPHVGGARVSDQMHAAHRYRNQLVEIERRRRAAVTQALHECFPEIAALEREADKRDEKIAQRRRLNKQRNAAGRRKTKPEGAAARTLKQIKSERKEIYARLRELKAAAWQDLRMIGRLDQIDAADLAERKAARAASGLYWGSYLTVEQSLGSIRRGAPPQFKSWRGDGKLALQIQGGLPVEAAFEGRDTRLRIIEAESTQGQHREGESCPFGSNGKNPRYDVWLRVGSIGRAREPEWAVVRATLHRPLPEDARIKWAYLMRRRVAQQEHWDLCFVLARESGWSKQDRASSGTVAVDLGWRLVEGGLRVAYWADDSGRKGELVLPRDRVAEWKKPDDLRAIRDDSFNAIRSLLQSWIASRPRVPDWLSAETQNLAQWRAPRRLVRLVHCWRNQRFEGDGEFFVHLESWCAEEKHLENWERHQARRLARWRLDVYRNFAADLRRRYKTVVLENCNWRQMQEHAPAEEGKSENKTARYNARIASVGRLAEVLGESAEVVRVDPKNTTQRCHVCGRLTPFDAEASLRHRCHHQDCAAEWDQDENAAKNLLAAHFASSEVRV